MRWFVKTCAVDLPWLSFCLRALAKHDLDAEVCVVTDDDFVGETDRVMHEAGVYSQRRWSRFTVSSFAPEAMAISRGYIRQQYLKLVADRVFPSAPHVQIDSDCFLLRTPVCADFSTLPPPGGKTLRPLWFFEPWGTVGQAVTWRAPTEAALGFSTRFETMRRHGFYLRPTDLQMVRSWIESVHGQTLASYLSGVRTFSEYNVIGSYLRNSAPESRTWIETPSPLLWGVEGSPMLEQGWGGRPMPAETITRWSRLLDE